MRMALVQINPTVGAFEANADLIALRARDAAEGGADLIVFPELCLTAYPPRDLLLQGGFLDAAHATTLALIERLPPVATTIIGLPWRGDPEADPIADPLAWREGIRPTNALLAIAGGRAIARHDKRLLPTYDVFDEHRYFRAGRRAVTIDVGGVRVGLTICEDLWKGIDVGVLDRYAEQADPVEELVRDGAELIVNPSASPFSLEKRMRQHDILRSHVERHGVAIASVNQVGGNDDLVFDGHAAVYAPGDDGPRLVAAGPGFVEAITTLDVPNRGAGWAAAPRVDDPIVARPPMHHLWEALVLGVRDYCAKTGFEDALIGVSGGIDSALTTTIAAAALGRTNVRGVAMPSRFSSEGSLTDAHGLAEALGIELLEVPIREPHEDTTALLTPLFDALGADPEPGVTDENIQSRLRGLILMAFSNKTGAILLTTGNKSELAVGYCTLYGDMAGGLAVLSDVSKQDVYALSRFVNEHHAALGFARPPIPESTITKAPSAELRANQTDQDSLPPYDVLDQIIERYVEQMQSPARIARETGFEPALVARIVRMIDLNEHKRKQMPIGLKVSGIAFGRGRRRPLAQRFRHDLG